MTGKKKRLNKTNKNKANKNHRIRLSAEIEKKKIQKQKKTHRVEGKTHVYYSLFGS